MASEMCVTAPTILEILCNIHNVSMMLHNISLFAQAFIFNFHFQLIENDRLLGTLAQNHIKRQTYKYIDSNKIYLLYSFIWNCMVYQE